VTASIVVVTPSSISLVASPASSSYGAAETLTATVPGQTQGSVAFSLLKGTTTEPLGTAPLTGNGTATLVTFTLPVGTDEVIAAFTPAQGADTTPGYAETTLTVVQDVPSITILGPTSVQEGSSEAYTILVAANGQPVSGGSLQVQLGGTSFVATLGQDGTATVSLTFPNTPGSAVISATYLGSPTDAMASNVLSVSVTGPSPSTAASSSQLPPTGTGSQGQAGSPSLGSASTQSGARPSTAASSTTVPAASTGEPFASPWWWVFSGFGLGGGSVGAAWWLGRRRRVRWS